MGITFGENMLLTEACLVIRFLRQESLPLPQNPDELEYLLIKYLKWHRDLIERSWSSYEVS